ncbi:copper amine oxidase [Penicillium brevicompactum]|uniref:Amine oxidase n=1 Tax=Penicillium brevicompactum TaxID=5074 RepID=A0A9W9RMR6_PENBR|nr:copper amine oxidase [Penicillium brevicompactum]
MSPNHPFDPLTSREIAKAAAIVRREFPAQTPNFRVITLKEPAKDQMIPFLDDQNRGGNSSKRPARTARVQVVLPGDWAARFVELWVDLDRAVIIKKEHLVGKHPYIDSDYMQAVEKACIEDPRIQEQIALLELPAGATVIVEAWAYATDGLNDMSQRTTMGWFYMRLVDDVDANYYAYPLDLCAEVSEDLKVTKIYQLPSGVDDRINDKPKPFDRRKIHGAETEYSPGLRSSPRTTTKPYQVIQPEGPSFKTQGNFLEWEKWSMHIGFNYREGLTLHDIRYEGRSLFYRISLAEMFVPYGDPRTPYPRKAAFDLGNDGAGINANNLRLGCDCLGHIKYFDGWHTTTSGDPVKLPNVICCHEEDDGILWKHTNFRTQNAVVARSRILVLQTIITVSNYEYIFAFHFGQDASIHYEVRATGILSTTPINVGDNVPYGTIVAPGVLAPYHQHLFSLRIDPAIDGHNNSLQIEESYPMPIDTPTFDHTGKAQAQVDSYANPFGVGYATRSSIVDHEGGLDLDFTKNRTFKIVNENVINPVTGTPVGFKLLPAYSQMLLAHPESYHAKRSEFATHAVWVTRHNDEEHFPSGRHTMQSVGGDGIATAIANRSGTEESLVRNKDIVVWHTFGSTHNPRIEDWPVMPSEKMTVGLKPVNFFTGNPGLDVALSTQESNRSVLVDGGDDTKPKSDCCKL